MMESVTHEDIGNLVCSQANMNNILLKQEKICFTLLELSKLVADLAKVTTNLILYGSCARGEDAHNSDIDLFSETTDKEIGHSILERYQKTIPRELSPVISTPNETYSLKLEITTCCA